MRVELYELRKGHMLATLKKQCEKLKNQVRFITAIVSDQLVVNKVKRRDLVATLKSQGYWTRSDLNKIQKDATQV